VLLAGADAGDLLDVRAKEAYRRRLAEIEEEIVPGFVEVEDGGSFLLAACCDRVAYEREEPPWDVNVGSRPEESKSVLSKSSSGCRSLMHW
jgi:hypothetical protein